MCPREDIDAVDLMQLYPLDRAAQMADAGRSGARGGKTLGGQRNTSRQRQSDLLYLHR